MNSETLDNAISEAERFLKKAKEVKRLAINDKYVFFGTKETAAAKRASMDLTRALAILRKPS